MSCLTKQMKLEAIENERARLYELEEQGMDVADAIATLDKLESALGDVKKVREVLKDNGSLEELQSTELSNLNKEKPRYKGAAVQIVGGRVIDGKVKVDFKYPNGAKVYTNVSADSISLNQTTVEKTVLFSAPNEAKAKKGRNILKAAKINNIDEVLGVFDMLDSIDNIGTTEEHKSKLKELLRTILGGMIDVIPEMGVYLDEEGKRNGGAISVNPGNYGIFMTKGLNDKAYGGEMSLVEKYTHEMIHAVLHWALNSTDLKAVQIKNRLIKLHAQAMKKLDWTMLLPDVSINKEAEEIVAKQTYDYLNSSKNALEEFIAYAATNEKVGKLLESLAVNTVEREPKGFIDKLVYWVEKLMKLVVNKWRHEPSTMKGNELVLKMILDLSKINNEATRMYKESKASGIEQYIEKMEDYLKSLVGSKLEGVLEKNVGPAPIGEGKWAEAKWFISNIATLVSDKKHTPVLKSTLARMFMKPEGLVQTFIQQLKETDDYQNLFEELGLLSVQVDRNREGTAVAMTKVVSAMFKKLNATKRKILQAGVLTLDGALLISKHGTKVVELYKDEIVRKAAVDKINKELEKILDVETYRYVQYQINGLAEYMKTGEGSLIQLRNARAIAMKAQNKSRLEDVDQTLVDLIDEAASLVAIEQMDQTLRDGMVEMLELEPEGMAGMADLVKGFNSYMDGREKIEEVLNSKKGYIRETYDDHITATVEPVADKLEMEEKGYKLVQTLPRGTIGSAVEMGLYINKSMMRLPFNKSAVRYVGDKQHGRTLFENYFKAEGQYEGAVVVEKAKQALAEGKKQAQKMLEAVRRGEVAPHDKTIMPQLSETGNVVDFVYVVRTEDKIKHLGLSVNGTEAIGRTWAHQIDVEDSEAINGIAWDQMMLDYAKNYTGGEIGADENMYVVLGSNSFEAELKDIFRILPPEYKKKLKQLKQFTKEDVVTDDMAERFVGKEVWNQLMRYQKDNLKKRLHKGEFAVRRDMLLKIFGFRDLSITNMMGVKLLPRQVKTLIKWIENLWKEFVKMYKVNVVLKTLAVPLENIVGNFLWLLTEWHNFKDLIDWQIEGAKGLTQWIKDEARMRELVGLVAAYPNNAEYRHEYERLQVHMDENPIKPLADAGLYTHINEDMGSGEVVSSNRFTRWVDSKTEGAPEFVKTGMNYLFVTEKTALFRGMQKFTMYGDFIARYAKYQLDMKKAEQQFVKTHKRAWTDKEKAVVQKVVIRNITKTFINYTDPDSALWQYMQDMGLFVFSKYGIRIQNTIRQQGTKHPIKMAIALAVQEIAESAVDIDVTNPAEYSFLAGHGLFVPGPAGIVEQMVENAVPWAQFLKQIK